MAEVPSLDYELPNIAMNRTFYKPFSYNKFTFDCIRSLSAMNSADPLPARAIPLTRAVDAPDPIPNVKHLTDIISLLLHDYNTPTTHLVL